MRRSLRSRTAQARALASDLDADDEHGTREDEQPLAELTESTRKGRRQTARRSQLEALQKLQSCRKARQQKSSKGKSSKAQDAASSDEQLAADEQSDDYGLQPIHKNSDSSDEADPDDLPRKSASKGSQIVDSPAARAKARSHAKLAGKRSRSQQVPQQAPRQQRSKFVAGGAERASSPESDGDLGDFLTPDTEEEEEEGAAKKLCRAGRKRPRSARERLNWSESSSSDGEAAGKTGSSSKQQQQGEDSTAGDLEEEPLPAKRARPLTYVLDGEEGWDAASLPQQAQPTQQPVPCNGTDSDTPAVAANKRQRLSVSADAGRESGDYNQQGPGLYMHSLHCADAASPSHARKGPQLRAAKVLTSRHDQQCPAGVALHHSSGAVHTLQPSQESHPLQSGAQLASSQLHRKGLGADSSDSEDMLEASRGNRRLSNGRTGAQVDSDELQEATEPVDAAAQLAEEGLDPLPEQPAEQRSSRRTSIGKPSRLDIRARMQQNQQKLRKGGKSPRRTRAAPLLANSIQQVWHGSAFTPPTDSDSEYSSSEATSASAESASEEDSDNSGAESDLDDFIVDDVGADRKVAHGSGVGDGDDNSDGEPAERRQDQPRSILQKAGFNMKQSDGDYFKMYIQYLVYDLVDKTFAVRLHQDKSLYRYYDEAVKHVEENMANRREMCVVSSAWMQAVPGLMDHLDTLPGLSSDWTDASDSHEAQDGVCQACQKGQTAGHAVKALTLKGKPYKPLWKYGYRRVSNAHVRSQLPWNDENRSSDDDQQEPDDGREEMKYTVGRFCCARLQMYHALMHYKHRLRGKLKKRIKKEYSLQRLRQEKQDWVKAADNYLQKSKQIESLYKNYKSLIDVATNFNTQVGSSWRRAMDSLQNQVDSLLYQLNSDSEGDEGSDIGANEGREAEESSQQEEDAQGAEDYDDADMGQPEASKQPDGKYDKDKQQADIRSSSNAAAKASAQSEHHSPAEPLHKSNEVQTSPDSPNAAAAEISMKGAVPKTAETLTAASQPHQSSTHQAGCKHTLANPEAEQLGATGPSQQSGLATLPYDAEPASTAEAATLPYDAATGGLLATDQAGGNSQELPGGAAAQNVDTRKGDPVAAGIIAASQGEGPLVDLTKDQAHESSGWHQEAPNAVEDKTELQQNHAGGTEKSPVNHASTPSRRDSTSSAALSPSSSAKKHKQVDIRQFVRSP